MQNQDAALPSSMFLATIDSFGGAAFRASNDLQRDSVMSAGRNILNEVGPFVEGTAPILPPRGRAL